MTDGNDTTNGHRGVAVPFWAMLVGLLVLALGIGAAAAAVISNNGDDNGGAVGVSATSTTSATALPGLGSSGGGASGGGGSGGTPTTQAKKKTPAPTVVPHLSKTDLGACASSIVPLLDVSWTTTNATKLTVTSTKDHITETNPAKLATGSYLHFGVGCTPDHVVHFTAEGPGGTTQVAVTLSYLIDEKPHIIYFTAPASTDCHGGATVTITFNYQTVYADSATLSVFSSLLASTSGSVSYPFQCPPMYLGTETYQVTLTATNVSGSTPKTVPVALHPTS